VKSVSETSLEVNAAMRSGFLPDRIIHLHPTRLCNLACLHCYSESNPHHQAALDPDVLCDALAVLRAEGYTLISLSGGEPLVYRPLRLVVKRAQELGFRVTMITNGLLATRQMDETLSSLDGIAISFDGLAASHNAMRGRPDAFDRACAALHRLATMKRPVAAAISLTTNAIPELPDLADNLVSLGARALQIRPVARAGRARLLMDGSFYTSDNFARLYLVVLALRNELPAEIRIHCDLAPAQGLWQQRDAYAGLLGDCGITSYVDRPLADLVNPLVITETGWLKPIAYDFAGLYDIANLHGLSSECLRTYKQTHLPELQNLVGGALAGLQGRHDLVDWFDHCTRLSELRRGAVLSPVPDSAARPM
jgi:organic radical activating enzyme